MKKILFLIALFTLMGGVNSVKAEVPSKQELTPTGSTFVKKTYKKFHVTGSPELAFTINPFDIGDNDKFVIDIAYPTTVGDWLICNVQEPYAHGGWWETISKGTSGPVELKAEHNKTTSLVLQAGNNDDGERDLILKDVYFYKEEGNVKTSILSTLGGTNYDVEDVAEEVGVKAFDMTNVNVADYQALVISFKSPTVGQWVLNIDGVEKIISAGTKYYKVDVAAKTKLNTLSLSVGSGPFPRANNFDKLYLSNPFTISSTEDWADFATAVAGGETELDAVLTADVDAGSTMVGADADGKRYQGFFDGAGHTLTFNYTGSDTEVGPFKCVQAATFIDLHVTGAISSSGQLIAGLIGKNIGATTITRCANSVDLTTNHSDSRPGGFVGRSSTDGANITFSYCVYDGDITAAKQGCGFVGWAAGQTMNVSHCLVASTSVTGGESNFIGGYGTKNISDSYYLTKFGSSTEGTQLTEQLRYSGQAAYNLNQGIGDGAWFFGQGNLNTSIVDDLPMLTNDASKKVWGKSPEYTSTMLYMNAGGAIPNLVRMKAIGWYFDGTESHVVNTVPADINDATVLRRTMNYFALKVGAARATTLVVPFTTTSLPTNVKAYELTMEGSDVHVEEVDHLTVNQPVLINAPAGEYIFSAGTTGLSDVPMETGQQSNWIAYSAGPTNGALIGVYNNIAEPGQQPAYNPFSYVPEDYYVLQDREEGLGFYRVEEANTIKITSFRAYLNAGGLARGFIGLDEMVTGINEVKVNKAAAKTGKIYNLNGQIVSKPTKGLFIVDGKVVSF